jgi:hypothetical protein
MKYKNHERALESASSYGYSETDKKHFNRSIIIQPENQPQYIICPDCRKKIG